MSELDYVLKDSFQLVKATGIGAALLLVLAFQLLFPNRLALRRLLRNWKVNLPMAAINTLVLSLLCGACVCTWAVTVRERHFGLLELAALPFWIEVGTTVVLLDLVAWAWHRANHASSLLWRFHAVHHSDNTFDASTAFRFHPGELLIALGVRLVVVTATGLSIAGLIGFEVIFGFFNFFVHSDIRMPRQMERRLGAVFVTPSLHRLHHSVRRDELNRNFGTIFSCWDRLARTHAIADARTQVTVGLPYGSREVGLRDAITLPFRRGGREDSVSNSPRSASGSCASPKDRFSGRRFLP